MYLHLNVRRIIIRDSVEEWMLTLQDKKRGLSEKTLGDDDGMLDATALHEASAGSLRMTANDLRQFFVQGQGTQSHLVTVPEVAQI
jgi:SNF2 family DNA or RNA helicase